MKETIVSKKIHFLGVADGLKNKIILERLLEDESFDLSRVVFLTEHEQGVAIDFCKAYGITFRIVDQYNLLGTIAKNEIEQADVLVSTGWTYYIPPSFYSQYDYAINCHGAFLPDYRGNKAYMAIYANIEDYYGVTVHFLTEKLDDGPIVKQVRQKLFPEETPLIIHQRIAELTAMILPESIRLIRDGYKGRPQQGKARYFEVLSRNQMNKIRVENETRLAEGMPKICAPHREWELNNENG